jgi:hypothetical protein
MSELPESVEQLDISHSDAYEHVELLEDHSVARIFDTASFFKEMDDKEVFTYRHNGELATVRRIGEDIVLEGEEEAKTALSYLEPS